MADKAVQHLPLSGIHSLFISLSCNKEVNTWKQLQRGWQDIPELIVGGLEGGGNGDVEEEGEEELQEPSFDHHQLSVEFSCVTTDQLDAPTSAKSYQLWVGRLSKDMKEV